MVWRSVGLLTKNCKIGYLLIPIEGLKAEIIWFSKWEWQLLNVHVLKQTKTQVAYTHLWNTYSISKSLKLALKSSKFSCNVIELGATSLWSSGKSTTPGRKAILILTNASLQSARRYLVLREYMRTTPSSKCPEVRRASFTWRQRGVVGKQWTYRHTL